MAHQILDACAAAYANVTVLAVGTSRQRGLRPRHHNRPGAHKISVNSGPHGLCVWPQPGLFSLGHTGNMR
jgi:hypothetical protein